MRYIIKGGVFLIITTLIISLGIYLFFDKRLYLEKFFLFSSFIFVPLYALVAIYQIYTYSKKNKEVHLIKSFGIPFLTLFIGGFFSLWILFLFFNYIDIEASHAIKNAIIKKWFEQNKKEMILEYGSQAYENRVRLIKKGNIFGLYSFFIFSFFLNLYYFILSILIGLFFRKKIS